MNNLALSLLGLEPTISDQWAQLFGLSAPCPRPARQLPPVPADVFGLRLSFGNWRQRRALLSRRRRAVADYLRENAGLTTEDVAEVFGITHQAAYLDLRYLAGAGRVCASLPLPCTGQVVKWGVSSRASAMA